MKTQDFNDMYVQVQGQMWAQISRQLRDKISYKLNIHVKSLVPNELLNDIRSQIKNSLDK